MTPAEADLLLEEWAHWQRTGGIDIGMPHATPFGRFIKPDPSPSRAAIDDARAEATDRVLAKQPGRVRFLIRVHYLDLGPVEKKAQRLRCSEYAYRLKLKGVQTAVAMALTLKGFASKSPHHAKVSR